MKEYNVKVNYLYNSGFTLETDNYFLIFDYFNDKPDGQQRCIENGVITEKELRLNKKIIVFSSHSHPDHFNPIILKWKDIRPDIKYILSDDIDVKLSESITLIGAYDHIDIDGIYVKAYGSTDIGISFFITVEGMNIFHAGDLNWWYWWDDTKEEIQKAENMFKEEIRKIEGNHIDIAFFPVDPRLEKNYYMGGKYFIEKLQPNIFIPMHFGETYDIISRFRGAVGERVTKIVDIDKRGQKIL
ncbi:MBL fold metallo-hydrolase [Clostridium oryzae]|uniref:Beta-lactamase superfamily domain protein n=1 Tax=Clostridium oryzae TaxID=1450648 RepID=A0A1V4IC19_9CLOT|nr:MBL fold metallo-hydrolase [Clostridium oryzae]OPJ57479.1 beta-lactamase superfamily domain protein [Clostridium oryzae]